MKKAIFLATGIIFITALSLKAQVAADSTAVHQHTDSTAVVKCCHGTMKPGCCAEAEGKSKKKKKGESCCAAKGNAQCCAHKGGEHAAQPCHPGCTMPCCTKKD